MTKRKENPMSPADAARLNKMRRRWGYDQRKRRPKK